MKNFATRTGWIAGLALALVACSDDGGGDGNTAGSGSGGNGTSGGGGSSSTAGMSGGGSKAGGSGGGGTSGSTGTSGSSTGGSTGTSGSSTGGSTGTGGSGSNNVCSPGKTTKAIFAYPDLLQNCGFEGKGELAGVEGYYASIKLPAPIGPGDEFAFSVGQGDLGEGKMELWGGTAECGEAHELLATVNIAAGEQLGTLCMTAKPETGTYPYLIWVMYMAGMHGDVTTCPDVSCPGE